MIANAEPMKGHNPVVTMIISEWLESSSLSLFPEAHLSSTKTKKF